MDELVLAAAAVELADDGYAGDNDVLGTTLSAPAVRKRSKPHVEETAVEKENHQELPEGCSHEAAHPKVPASI